MKLTAFCAIACCAVTSAAQAQMQDNQFLFDGVQYLSYGGSYLNQSGNGQSSYILNGQVSMDYRSDNVIFSGNFDRLYLEDGDLTLNSMNGRLGYILNRDYVVYAGLAYAGGSGIANLTSYHIGGEAEFGNVTVGLKYDESDDQGSSSLTTAYGGYSVGDAFEVSLFVTDDNGNNRLRVDYDAGPVEIAASFGQEDGSDVLAVNGLYDFGNSFRAGGNYVDFNGEVDYAGAKAGYEVSDDMWVDVSVGRVTNGNGDDFDVIGLTLKYEIGSETLLFDRSATAETDSLGILGQSFGGF